MIGNILTRPLRPLIRLAVARNLLFPELTVLLKRLYIEAAEAELQSVGNKVTDSQISVRTGLQRRDIAKLRGDLAQETPAVNHFARLVSLWQNQPPFGADGRPRPLPRKGEVSFDALAETVRRDVHPRTQFEVLLANGTISHDPETDQVTLAASSYLPGSGTDEQMAYFAANVGDHAAAGAANILSDPPPFFERAVHYNGLGPDQLAELQSYAAKVQENALQAINARALALQSGENTTPTGRFRCGAFVFSNLKGVQK